MDINKYYRVSEIISHPEVEAREADPAEGTPARKARPARRGLLPFSETHFYRLLKAGKFPKHDAEISGTKLWSGKLIRQTLNVRTES